MTIQIAEKKFWLETVMVSIKNAYYEHALVSYYYARCIYFIQLTFICSYYHSRREAMIRISIFLII